MDVQATALLALIAFETGAYLNGDGLVNTTHFGLLVGSSARTGDL